MAEWRTARALLTLRQQVDRLAPKRDKSWDGTIGNEEHAVRTSDHNPWVRDGEIGIVTAMDITHDPDDGFDSYAFADHLRLIKDRRIKYVISNGRIFNSVQSAWVWRPYSGPNDHSHHVHISVRAEKVFYDSMSPWDLGGFESPTPDKPFGKPFWKRLFLSATGEEVEYLQRMLGIPVTGVFDEMTQNAVIEFQKRYALVVDGIVGPATWEQLEA
jgi:peptidoglycan hydrolase-like protein with peptidoglycan-binding domain